MSVESSRIVVHYCPFCGDEDGLRPTEQSGEWECRGCRRAFTVRSRAIAAEVLA